MKPFYMIIPLGNPRSTTRIKTRAYKSKVAGLAVHRQIYWNSKKNRAILHRCKWVIAQWPTGLKAFDNFPTKESALLVTVEEMTNFNWVGFSPSDIMKSNDKKQISELVQKVCKRIEQFNKELYE